jgi:hypothetical protein
VADVAELADALDSKLHFWPFFWLQPIASNSFKTIDFIDKNQLLLFPFTVLLRALKKMQL